MTGRRSMSPRHSTPLPGAGGATRLGTNRKQNGDRVGPLLAVRNGDAEVADEAGLRGAFLAHGGEIQAMLLFDRRFFMVFMIAVVIMRDVTGLRGLQDAQLVFVWLIVHIVR